MALGTRALQSKADGTTYNAGVDTMGANGEAVLVKLASPVIGDNTPLGSANGHLVDLGTGLNVTSDEVANGASAGQTGALKPFKFVTDGATKFMNVKTTPGRVYGLEGGSAAGSVCFLKLYDKATIPLTSDVPKHTYALLAGKDKWMLLSPGVGFANGIGLGVTGGGGDSDNTAVASGLVFTNMDYM
jgi:hypothetical protein